MYKESKNLDGLKAHDILSQRAINNYYLKPNYCKGCQELIKIKLLENATITRSKIFCSKSCSTSYNNSFRERTVKIYNCCKCNKECAYRKKYCESCKNNLYFSEDVTIEEVMYTNHHKSASFSYIRDRAKAKLKKVRERFCECCGYDKHVECAHIKPICNFELSSKVSEVNDIENLLYLCPNHHWEFDFGGLTIEEISKSVFYHKK